jgi:hypothetical protein
MINFTLGIRRLGFTVFDRSFIMLWGILAQKETTGTPSSRRHACLFFERWRTLRTLPAI